MVFLKKRWVGGVEGANHGLMAYRKNTLGYILAEIRLFIVRLGGAAYPALNGGP